MTIAPTTTRTFGVEFEGFGIPIHTLVSRLQAAGINARAASYSGSNYQVWQVKPDGSINGQHGFEVVSPVLSAMNGILEVKKVLEIVRANGGDANKSCGFHIHWGVADWRITHFRNFYKRWAKFERGIDITQPESRRADNAYYCQSVYSLTQGRHNVQDTDVLVQNMFSLIDSCRSVNQLKDAIQGRHTRYCKLNLAKFHRTGTMEIRQHSGSFDEAKVLNWIALTGAMVADTDNGKAVKNFTSSPSPSKVLDTLLGGLVRVGGIESSTRTFFKKRVKELAARIQS